MNADSDKSETLLMQLLSGVLRTDDGQRIELADCLHKDIAGSLVAGVSLGEMIRHALEREPGNADIGGLLSSLDSALRQALQIVRDLTEKQFPPVLKAFGLIAALQQLARQIGESFAGSLVLNVVGEEPKFEMATRLNIFRLMEALLKYCVRYAGTSWVEVTCRATPDKMEITIDHEGGEQIWKEGGGAELAVPEARCILLGSRMQVTQNGPGSGTRISLVAIPSQPK